MSDFTSTPATQASRLVSERTTLMRQIAPALTRISAIEAELVNVLDPGKNIVGTPFGKVAVTKSENNTYDKGVITAQLRPGQLQRVTKRVVDTALTKTLYPEVHAASKKSHGYRLSFGSDE